MKTFRETAKRKILKVYPTTMYMYMGIPITPKPTLLFKGFAVVGWKGGIKEKEECSQCRSQVPRLGLLSLILKSLIKSLMPKAPIGACIRRLHSKGCC